MSDLVLGLLVLGAVLFAGVVVYNRVQERLAERAFRSQHADALMESAPPARREPVLARAESSPQAQPDDGVDYVIVLAFPQPAAPAVVQEAWAPVKQRFGRRVLLAESNGAWRAALQLVSRAGVVSDAELIEFRTEVDNLAAKLGASVSAPEMRQALDAARELDRTCADSDIQVALHVIAENLEPPADEQPFQVVRREDGVTLVLDVALTRDLVQSYEAMARAGRSLATAHGGRLVDDRGNPLDDRALAAIGAQLEAVRQTLAARGIDTGSPLALRLFS
jgi:hypothetical protein